MCPPENAPMIHGILRAARRVLEANGYYLQPRRALPYGVDYLLDVQRLAAAWGWPIRTFFDVGANDGESSLAAIAQFPEASIFAFEPSAQTYERLCRRIAN